MHTNLDGAFWLVIFILVVVLVLIHKSKDRP